MALLEVENLSVEFVTTHGKFRAVDHVSIYAEEGEVIAVVGESGSGKSVSMLAIMGLLPWTATVSADKMKFDDKDMLNMSSRDRRKIIGKDIAMIFQEPMSSLNPCFTVGYQLGEALKKHLGLRRCQRRERVVEILDSVGIPAPEKRLSAFPHQLSGGMNQRIMIAMAISCQPKLLIADEPTTALDVTIQAQILDLLSGLQKNSGMTLVLITHDMGVVAETAQKVSVQYAGQKVESQEVKGLFNHPFHPYTQALLSALPERSQGKMLEAIPGVVPGQFDQPKGCLFSPRCQYVQDICRQTGPEPAAKAFGQALCHFPLVNGKPQERYPEKRDAI